MIIQEKIKQLSTQYFDEIVAIRRHFHAHPEIAFEEYGTASYIIKKLEEYHIPYTSGIAKTGIVAIVAGNNPARKIIALRADMDALLLNEVSQEPYKSQNKGVMHACGHDAHMASMLGTARILNDIKNLFSGTVKIIFQPSEEKFPGGASVMIQEGVLENPSPSVIFGQHVLPTMNAGKAGMRAGKYMASTDEIYITIYGKGGHAATPELNIDPILISSHIIIALQQIVSRNALPSIPTVLSFGRIVADGRTNIIPDEVTIEGTFRTFDEAWRECAHKKIVEMSNHIAQSMGATCNIRIDKGYPFLVNDNDVTARAKTYAQEYLGEENVEDLEMRLTAEDFAYYSQKIPACFYRLGVRNESKEICSNLHTNSFNIDESALETGMGLMAWMAYRELNLE